VEEITILTEERKGKPEEEQSVADSCDTRISGEWWGRPSGRGVGNALRFPAFSQLEEKGQDAKKETAFKEREREGERREWPPLGGQRRKVQGLGGVRGGGEHKDPLVRKKGYKIRFRERKGRRSI